jgi:hypothetical protein
MRTCVSAFLLALASSSAFAQVSASRSLDDVLTHDEGMTLISDGLYAQSTGSGESWVAVNPAGQRALRVKLQELRAKWAKQSKPAAASKSPAFAALDRSIAQLSTLSPDQIVEGDCTGPGGTAMPSLYARATSSGGYTASGYAVRQLDFGPGTPTQNAAWAETDNPFGDPTSQQTGSGVGDQAASATATAVGRRCQAFASASITCPGQSSPAIAASAYSQAGDCIR